ncbi:bifunctional UDP-sugar hydrolase/5'-nucleotidase UshA [Cardiobacteriaceae bacterium TAE3-ERU3]|nr:bifunctional UDP-sugar hydrolase/5'-nucleotidase UshA [Cardiobacteriaceae bacterium TAE3-ERU3]
MVLQSGALLAFLLGTGCATSPQWQADETYKLTVLHTNDHHGRFWHNEHGEYGMAARKTLIDRIRKEVAAQGGEVLLFSGGDINTGVPESDLQDAEPDFKGMNRIGYDAMAIGNHEFDNALSVLAKQIDWAGFPVLSANIYDRETGKRMFEPYHVFNKHGIKIAVVGLTTEDTQKIGNPEYISGVEFRNPVEEMKKVLVELDDKVKPDLIFAVTHMGHYQDGQHGVNAPGDVTLARALPPGKLDMIVGGHSQEPVCMEPGDNHRYDANFKPGADCKPDQQNGTWIVQAHEWGKYVGRADYTFKDGELTLVEYRLIPVNLKKKVEVNGEKQRVFIEEEIPADEEMLAFLTPYQEKGQAELNTVIGKTNGKLEGDRDQVRFKQTNLAHLIAKAQMERVKADFGVMNSGGVRDSIEAGDVTYKDVLKVQPFGNTVGYVDMRGDEVRDYLNEVALMPTDTGAYAQFANIAMTVGKNGVSNVRIGGKPLQDGETYRFSVPSFNAVGGDGYPDLSQHAGYVNSGFVDAEVLKDYIESHSPLDVNQYAPKGEIVYQ